MVLWSTNVRRRFFPAEDAEGTRTPWPRPLNRGHRRYRRTRRPDACGTVKGRVPSRHVRDLQGGPCVPVQGCIGGGRGDPPCDIPSGCCSFTGPWTVTRSSLRMLRRVAAFCRPLRPVLLLVSFPRSRSPVGGVPGLCWMWRGVAFVRQWRPAVGVLRLCWLLPRSFDWFCCPRTSVHRPSIACLAVFPCA